MMKKIIPILVVATAFAACGLVTFQLSWISEARRTKEEEFNNLVNSTLSKLVADMEKNEIVFQIINDLSPNSTYVLKNARSNIRSLQRGQEQFIVNLFDSLSVSKRFTPINDPTIAKQLHATLLEIDEQQRKQAQLPPEDIKLNEKLNYKKVLVENIVEKIISIEVPIEQRISKNMLDSLIRKEFNHRGLDLNFEFSVYHANGDVLFGSANHHAINDEQNAYVYQLFPNDLLSERCFLKVAFPHKATYVFFSIGSMMFYSLALIIIVLGIFTMTIWTLLHQKKLSQMRSDFVNNMTHELKTPIATITLASEMLCDADIPSDESTHAHIAINIRDQAKRLTLLVERTLQMSMLEHEQLLMHVRPHDFHTLANKVLDSFKLQAGKSNASIARAFSASYSTIEVDEVHFSNILINLIDNALKYANGTPLIVVQTKNVEDKLHIQVRDNGIGIAPSDQKRIFEQFYRAHTGNRHNIKGFGLGLNYVKKIVEMHGGKIWVESELGKGSLFNIAMPLPIKMQG
jgi:nitrogen-specific signal transduction histidine kinase